MFPSAFEYSAPSSLDEALSRSPRSVTRGGCWQAGRA